MIIKIQPQYRNIIGTFGARVDAEKMHYLSLHNSLFFRIYCYLWWIKSAAYYSKSIKSGGGESRRALIKAHLGERISIKVLIHSNPFLLVCVNTICGGLAPIRSHAESQLAKKLSIKCVSHRKDNSIILCAVGHQSGIFSS